MLCPMFTYLHITFCHAIVNEVTYIVSIYIGVWTLSKTLKHKKRLVHIIGKKDARDKRTCIRTGKFVLGFSSCGRPGCFLRRPLHALHMKNNTKLRGYHDTNILCT